MKRFVVFLVLGFICGPICAAPDSAPETALSDYVHADDPSFSWQKHASYTVPGAEVVELRLHSQTWQNILWKHRLYVIRPENASPDARDAMLIVAGGRWRDSYETEAPAAQLPPESALFIELAKRLGTVVAVIGQVPFQPMFDLKEDDLIAYTFEQYLKTGDADWPLLLPMVKATVKGMDAVQAFAEDEWDLSLERFSVLGGSKRGWTTWLSGAVDERVDKLVPIVIDVLNFEAQMPHQSAFWGAPSQALEPYSERNLLQALASEGGAALRRIVDPYAYRDKLTQPKLIINATNDVFFPIDDLNLYWNGLEGPKHVLYVPNNGHNVNDFGRVIPTIVAFARDPDGARLPSISWQYQDAGKGVRLCVTSDPAPTGVVLWTAVSEDSDFRDEVFESSPFAAAGGSGAGDVYTAEVQAPASGYEVMFAELAFGEGDARYTLSTNVRVIDATGRPPEFSAALDGDAEVCPR